MNKDALWIENALELAMAACEQIHENGQCHHCPLWGKCLDDCGTSFGEMADLSANTWATFLELSDESVRMRSSDEYDYADMMRKMEQEEAMIDEYELQMES